MVIKLLRQCLHLGCNLQLLPQLNCQLLSQFVAHCGWNLSKHLTMSALKNAHLLIYFFTYRKETEIKKFKIQKKVQSRDKTPTLVLFEKTCRVLLVHVIIRTEPKMLQTNNQTSKHFYLSPAMLSPPLAVATFLHIASFSTSKDSPVGLLLLSEPQSEAFPQGLCRLLSSL